MDCWHWFRHFHLHSISDYLHPWSKHSTIGRPILIEKKLHVSSILFFFFCHQQNEQLRTNLYFINWYKFNLSGMKTTSLLLQHARNENPKEFILCSVYTLNLETATIVTYTSFKLEFLSKLFSLIICR